MIEGPHARMVRSGTSLFGRSQWRITLHDGAVLITADGGFPFTGTEEDARAHAQVLIDRYLIAPKPPKMIIVRPKGWRPSKPPEGGSGIGGP